MVIKRRATAHWQGSLAEGGGGMETATGAVQAPFSLRSRVEDTPQTNPEELIGAAHAGCFSMALSNLLSQEDHPPQRVETTATVHLAQREGGFSISRIELDTIGDVEGIDEARFRELADQAKATCPVSRALAGVEIVLQARLGQAQAS
jgi:osmotically inducible protein OsmC